MEENDEIKESLERVNEKYGNALQKLSDSEKKERTEKKFEALREFGEVMREEMKEYDTEASTWWDNLSYDDRLKAFYCVCKRIHKGDIVEQGSYRHVLYEVFGFDFDAYTIGMECGYLDIHNSIVTKDKDTTK